LQWEKLDNGATMMKFKVVREPGGKATAPRLVDAHLIFDAAMRAEIAGKMAEHGQLMQAAKLAWIMAASQQPKDDRRGRRRIRDSEALDLMAALVRAGAKPNTAARQIVASGEYVGQRGPAGEKDRRHESLVRLWKRHSTT
jgi:hypothetical protein